MANAPFDRPIVNGLEKPLSTDVNLVAAYGMNTLTELLRVENRVRGGNLIPDGSSGASASGLAADVGRGFIGDGFMPYWGGGMQVKLRAGIGFYTNSAAVQRAIGSVSGLDDVSVWQPLVLQSDLTTTVPANAAGSARIDLIEVRVARQQINAVETYTLSPVTGGFGTGQKSKTLSYAVDDDSAIFDVTGPSTTAVGYRVGTAGAGVGPTVSPGYVAVGYVYVPASTSSALSAAAIYDFRRILHRGGIPIVVKVAFLGGAAGGLDLNDTLVHAPPGVEVAVVDDKADSKAGFTIYVFAGDAAQTSLRLPTRLFTVGTFGDSGTTTSFLALNADAITADVLDSTDVANLADVTLVSPKPLSKTAGFQWAWKASYRTHLQASGTTNNTVPANSTMTVQLLLLPKGGY